MIEYKMLSNEDFYSLYNPLCEPIEESGDLAQKIETQFIEISKNFDSVLSKFWKKEKDFFVGEDWNISRSIGMGVYKKKICKLKFTEILLESFQNSNWVIHVACEIDKVGIGEFFLWNNCIYFNASDDFDYSVFFK